MTKPKLPALTARQRAAGIAASVAAAAESAEAVAPKNAPGGTVTVACKVAVGWIDLQMCKIDEVHENTQAGPRKIKQAHRIGGIVRIRGTAYPRGEKPDGFPERPEMASGAALTPGVSREFWDAWVAQNALNPMVVHGMIFAHAQPASVKAEAKEREKELSGLEPIQRRKVAGEEKLDDKRVARSVNANVTTVEPDGERSRQRSAA